jgi:hypothetical protein
VGAMRATPRTGADRPADVACMSRLIAVSPLPGFQGCRHQYIKYIDNISYIMIQVNSRGGQPAGREPGSRIVAGVGKEDEEGSRNE